MEEEEAEEKEGGGEEEEEEEVARSRVNEPREDESEKDVTHPFNRETLWFLISGTSTSTSSLARVVFFINRADESGSGVVISCIGCSVKCN